jgi:hypothetical protein
VKVAFTDSRGTFKLAGVKALGVLVVAVLLGVAAPVAFAQDQPPLPNLPNSAEIQLKVERDGALSVIEAISVPTGTTMTRRVPLKVPAPHNLVRVYGVRDVVIEGAGTAETSADEFVVNLRGGTSVIRYTVDGAVAADQVSWQLAGGWDTELKLVRASFAAPLIPDAVDCLAGPDGSDLTCGAAQIDHAGLTRFSQQNLPAGQRMDVTVELPPGTVPGNARFQPAKTLAGAFVLTAPVGWAWVGFALLALAAAVWLWLARRRAKVVGGPLPVTLTLGDGVFTSPEAVLPGHAGLLLSGRADAVDLAATVLDLAVRNYLWVSEVPGEHGLPEWRLARRNPADDQLGELEQAVFAAVLPEGTESVLLSELRSAGVRIDDVRDAFGDEVVRRRWLRRRGKVASVGVRMIFYGVFLTALLARTVGYAQLGLMVLLAGALLALGGRAIPLRTRKGAELRRRLLGMRDELHGTRARDVPELERGRLFSRALPYALVLGEARQWADAFAEPKRPLELYWYEPGEREDGTRRAGEFASALVGAFAGGRPGTSSPGRSILLASSP